MIRTTIIALILLAPVHHGDCCDRTIEYARCDGLTYVYTRVWWTHCNYRDTTTRECVPGSIQCLPIGSVRSLYSFPSIDQDGDGLTDVGLAEFAEIQNAARLSCLK